MSAIAFKKTSKRMPKIRTLFCLVDIEKAFIRTSCVFQREILQKTGSSSSVHGQSLHGRVLSSVQMQRRTGPYYAGSVVDVCPRVWCREGCCQVQTSWRLSSRCWQDRRMWYGTARPTWDIFPLTTSGDHKQSHNCRLTRNRQVWFHLWFQVAAGFPRVKWTFSRCEGAEIQFILSMGLQ